MLVVNLETLKSLDLASDVKLIWESPFFLKVSIYVKYSTFLLQAI